jgi:hypothetical protein
MIVIKHQDINQVLDDVYQLIYIYQVLFLLNVFQIIIFRIQNLDQVVFLKDDFHVYVINNYDHFYLLLMMNLLMMMLMMMKHFYFQVYLDMVFQIIDLLILYVIDFLIIHVHLLIVHQYQIMHLLNVILDVLLLLIIIMMHEYINVYLNKIVNVLEHVLIHQYFDKF